MKSSSLQIGDMQVEVLRKDIKNVHMSVHPPTGRVRIAAPHRMNMDTLRFFAISKLPWIRSQQRRMEQQDRETPREYIDRESHFVWGRRCLLRVVEVERPPLIELGHRHILLRVRPGTDSQRREALIEHWFREQVRLAAPPIVAKWEPIMGVKVEKFYVQHMKTKWGSCNPRTGTIRLNTDLAKKPGECLEYIIIHEMTHLLEPTHNERFMGLMDRFLPAWRLRRETLNRMPIRHETWSY